MEAAAILALVGAVVWEFFVALNRAARAIVRAVYDRRPLDRVEPPPVYPSSPRLAPDGSGYICDQCGREWCPWKGEWSGCVPCTEAAERSIARRAGKRFKP